jgi:hypothetical protein
VSVRIRDASDLQFVIDLFRLNYERPWLASGTRRATATPGVGAARGPET